MTTPDPLDSLRAVVERSIHPRTGDVILTGDDREIGWKLARFIASPEAVLKVAREIDPGFWNTIVEHDVWVLPGGRKVTEFCSTLTLADFTAHPSMKRALAVLRLIALEGVAG